MPIGPTSGFLDFTNATPRANVIIALSNVGVGTDLPLHALDIRGTANVADIIINNDLTLVGGLTTNTLTINSVSMSTTSNFQQVTNVGDAATTNTVQFTNPTTGFTVSSNAEVGGELSVSGNTEVGTANLFVDTTTGNVGVGTTEPTESLDIVGNLNLQKVSNTASIKLNSNVVTEYTRSKKLIKYPRKVLNYLAGSDAYGTAYNASGYQGYKVTRSSNYPAYEDWEAFDNDIGVEGTQLWASDTTASAGSGYNGYDNTTFVALTNNPNGQHPSAAGNGDWIQIELPSSIYPHTLRMHPRSAYLQNPKTFVFVASEDNSNWVVLIQNGTAPADWSANFGGWGQWEMDSLRKYKYFAVIVTATINDVLCAIKEIEILGVPEYDPEAHGTDVIARSVPNVPNTDWLEVYYDAKGLSDGSISTVDDLTPGGSNDGTATNLTVSDEAFVFNGTSDHTLAKNSDVHLPGGRPIRLRSAVWVNISTSHTLSDAYQYIFRLGQTKYSVRNYGPSIVLYDSSERQFVIYSVVDANDFPLNHIYFIEQGSVVSRSP